MIFLFFFNNYHILLYNFMNVLFLSSMHHILLNKSSSTSCFIIFMNILFFFSTYHILLYTTGITSCFIIFMNILFFFSTYHILLYNFCDCFIFFQYITSCFVSFQESFILFQHVWMGFLSASGAFSRVLGPILVSYLYTYGGSQWTFGVLTGLMVINLAILLILYKKLQPKSYVDDGKNVKA